MARRLALDSNVALLLAVGRTSPELVTQHKRLRGYERGDFELLEGMLAGTDSVVTTPLALSEISNLAPWGFSDPWRGRVVASVRGLVNAFTEVYNPSRSLVSRPEFTRLGLADCAWLALLDKSTTLITVDLDLYLEALAQGHKVTNFNHERTNRGLA